MVAGNCSSVSSTPLPRRRSSRSRRSVNVGRSRTQRVLFWSGALTRCSSCQSLSRAHAAAASLRRRGFRSCDGDVEYRVAHRCRAVSRAVSRASARPASGRRLRGCLGRFAGASDIIDQARYSDFAFGVATKSRSHESEEVQIAFVSSRLRGSRWLHRSRTRFTASGRRPGSR